MSGRPGHVKIYHTPDKRKNHCSKCFISWTSNQTRQDHAVDCAAAEANVDHWFFSKVLGIYIRPNVVPTLYFEDYEAAEQADPEWAKKLNRLELQEGANRLEKLTAELDEHLGRHQAPNAVEEAEAVAASPPPSASKWLEQFFIAVPSPEPESHQPRSPSSHLHSSPVARESSSNRPDVDFSEVDKLFRLPPGYKHSYHPPSDSDSHNLSFGKGSISRRKATMYGVP